MLGNDLSSCAVLAKELFYRSRIADRISPRQGSVRRATIVEGMVAVVRLSVLFVLVLVGVGVLGRTGALAQQSGARISRRFTLACRK